MSHRRTANRPWAALGRVLFLLGVGSGCGCPGPKPLTPAVVDAGPADAGPPKLPDLKLSLRAQILDGGWSDVSFEGSSRPFIEPTQALRVATNLALSNYRIRVFDEADRAMVSDDELRAGADGGEPVDYFIHFATPLKTGHRYSVTVDAQTGAAFNDGLGRSQGDQRIDFQIIGQREKDAPPKRNRTRRRH